MFLLKQASIVYHLKKEHTRPFQAGTLDIEEKLRNINDIFQIHGPT
jgi:pyridoxal biosynthesis lyase PdxS